jgi:Zn-dependent protease
MLIDLLNQRLYIQEAILIFIGIVIALTFHEFGHAWSAKMFGDNTAQKAGRLTLNPIAHLDPVGTLMVMMVWFGYAKPVPTDPRNFRHKIASPAVAFAGPAMNLFLAVSAANIWVLSRNSGIDILVGPVQSTFFNYFVLINLMLFMFNLLPIGPLDGHYIAEYLLPRPWNYHYHVWNSRYGVYVLLGAIIISILGFPVFQSMFFFAQSIIPKIQFM